MQALQIDRYGSPSELKACDVQRPTLAPDDVLVEVVASAINPSDAVSVEGRFPHSPLPRIVGRDFAGRVLEGPAHLIGAEVWGAGEIWVSRGTARTPNISLFLSPPSRSARRCCLPRRPLR